MSEKLSYAQYKQLVEEQAQKLLDALAFAATGDLDVQVQIPEGVEPLTDLAIGFSYLVEDMQELLSEQVKVRGQLEQRVSERTQALADRTEQLETALAELQAVQRRYLHEEWENYLMALGDDDLSETAEDEALSESSSWVPVLSQAVEQEEVVAYTNGGQRSALAVPVSYADELIGVLGFAGEETADWDTDDLVAVEAIAEQVGLALENQRLFEQTQAALAESEALYNFSARLNVANTLEEILEAVATINDAEWAMLFSIDTERYHRPERLTLNAQWRQHADSDPTLPLGTRFAVSQFPISELWIENPRDPHLFSDIVNDEQVGPETREFASQLNSAASAWLPLKLGQRWIGLLVTSWPTPRTFNAIERRMYKTVIGQTAVAVNQHQLTEQTRERAELLEKLSQIELALSQATDEPEIVDALSSIFEGEGYITLQYLDTAEQDRLTTMQYMAIWSNGTLLPASAPIFEGKIDVRETFPGIVAHLESHPNDIIYSEDIATESRYTPENRQAISQLDICSSALIPLSSGGRWQGSVSLSWREPHQFTESERFLYERLQEPLAAIVANRRAQIARQEAQRETEMLYYASQRVNKAGGNLQEIIAAIGSVNPEAPINRALLFLFDYVEREMVSMTVAANWYNGEGTKPTPIGTRYPRAVFASVSFVLGSQPAFFVDARSDERVDEISQQVFIKQNIAAVAVLPLWVGSRQVGAILLESEIPYEFSEKEIRPYLSLAPQIAVAVQNKLLYDEAQSRARREQILREITERVRSATDVDSIMKTAVQEIGLALGRKAFIYLNNPNEPVEMKQIHTD